MERVCESSKATKNWFAVSDSIINASSAEHTTGMKIVFTLANSFVHCNQSCPRALRFAGTSRLVVGNTGETC